jgi:hypothetical protein
MTLSSKSKPCANKTPESPEYAIIDPAIKHLNKDSAMPNRMPHFRESEKWPNQ